MPLRFAHPASEYRPESLTIGHLLDGGEFSDGDQEIVYRGTVRLTYRTFRQRIHRLAAALDGLGVKQGSVVAVLDWDSHRYLECFFAIPMMGAVLQMANVRLSPAQLQFTLADTGAQVLLVHRDFLPLVEAMRTALPAVDTIVLLDDEQGASPRSVTGEYEALLSAASARYRFEEFDENAIATTFYTSGTTGLPKAVAFSHRQLVLHTLAVAAAVAAGPGLGRDDVYMPLTPMFHVHAWGFPYVATMLGLKQVYPGRYDPDAIVRLRREERVTFSHCVPTVLRMVVDAAQAVGERLDGWRLLIGGSALTGALRADATALGTTPINAFGMSETGPVVALGESGAHSRRTGRAIPLTRLRVVDEAMRQLPQDDASLGELVVRAPWLTTAYIGNSEASAALWRGGWLHTQDIATMDARGSIMIRDRAKDVIKTGGEWVSSLTLEELIATHPAVSEVAIVGVPHPKWDERPIAVIVACTDIVPTRAEIADWLRCAIADGTISRYAVPDAVVALDALPRTSVGKIDKRALRELAVSALRPAGIDGLATQTA